MAAADFRPPAGLRHAHVQTMLSSGPLRRPLALRRSRILRSRATPLILDAGEGVRLGAFYSAQSRGIKARGLLVLVHGWEGHADSNYVLEAGARALAEGWDVVRVNLRDHGGTHALNRDFFHSCRIREAVGVLATIAARWPTRPLALAGFSLGGNFALRMALRAPAAGIDLTAVLAVCPVIDPTHSMLAIEASSRFYHRYFMHKWSRSLRAKERAFPGSLNLAAKEYSLGLRDLTRLLVQRHSDFGTLEAYLDGYSVAGDRLAGLEVPARLLTSRDDPIIPVADFEPLRAIQALQLEVTEYGGHCGFISDYKLHSWCPDYLAHWLRQLA